MVAGARRLHLALRPLAYLVATMPLLSQFASAVNLKRSGEQGALAFNQLFGRAGCSGQLCGWNNQLCCGSGTACYTDANDQAQCSTVYGGAATTAAAGGYYSYYTTTYVMTDFETVTSVMSTFIAGATAASASCNYNLNETPCGAICCANGQYCYTSGTCRDAGGSGSSGSLSSYGTSTNAAGAPILPTSSTLVVTTATVSPTTTVPFESPVATGSNVTVTSSPASSGGLSGGAIAGIVIGVLAGLLLLGLLCFYCCLKGLLDGCLAILGLGGRRKRRTVKETDVYERRSHHSGGGRTWYGSTARPARVERVERREEHKDRNRLLGLGAGLAGLAAILGFKKRNDRRRDDEKYSDYTYSSDYYTSASSASSDDRRTRTMRAYSRSRR